MTIHALLRPIQSWGQLAVGITILVAIPTALVLLIDYLDGGLGNKVGTEALRSVMIGSAWRGVVEELLFRGVIPSFIFLMAVRVVEVDTQKASRARLLTYGLSSVAWILWHPLEGGPWFQIIQLTPAALFYVNSWRGGKWAVAAIVVHPVSNVIAALTWEALRNS